MTESTESCEEDPRISRLPPDSALRDITLHDAPYAVFPFQLECYSCFAEAGVKMGQRLGLLPPQQRELTHRIIHGLNEISLIDDPPHSLAPTPVVASKYVIYDNLRDIVGDDPFAEAKSRSNLEAQQYVESIWSFIRTEKELPEGDPLYLVLLTSAFGNTIDFGSIGSHQVEGLGERISDLPNMKFTVLREYDRLKSLLQTAKTLLILLDNSGEVVFDKILLEFLVDEYPQIERIFAAVRGGPIINDVTVEMAHSIGISEIPKVTVLKSGEIALPGTPQPWRPEFADIFETADLILSKGQGNIETLLGRIDKTNLWFLLMSKCAVISRLLNVEEGSLCLLPPTKDSLQW